MASDDLQIIIQRKPSTLGEIIEIAEKKVQVLLSDSWKHKFKQED